MSQVTGERLVPQAAEPHLWSEHMARYAFAAEFCRDRRVLDIGCGTGYGSAHLAAKARHVTAIDASSEAIDACREYKVPNLNFALNDARGLAFAQASFDLVVAFEVIEHIDRWSAAMDEINRVLTEDGVALISTPNVAYYTDSRGDAGPNPFHVHEFDYEEFRTELMRRFPNVSVLLQNWSECLAFYPHRLFPPVAASLDSAAGEATRAHFFVAVCAKNASAQLLRSFVYVPRAANLLRERELHIASLERELVEVSSNLSQLTTTHSELNDHLEHQNRWALSLSRELDEARRRISVLQDELASQQASAQGAIDRLEASLRDEQQKAVAALDSARQEMEDVRSGYEREIDRLQRTLEGRVHELEGELDRARVMLEQVRESRWVRAGRRIRVGPEIPPQT